MAEFDWNNVPDSITETKYIEGGDFNGRSVSHCKVTIPIVGYDPYKKVPGSPRGSAFRMGEVEAYKLDPYSTQAVLCQRDLYPGDDPKHEFFILEGAMLEETPVELSKFPADKSVYKKIESWEY